MAAQMNEAKIIQTEAKPVFFTWGMYAQWLPACFAVVLCLCPLLALLVRGPQIVWVCVCVCPLLALLVRGPQIVWECVCVCVCVCVCPLLALLVCGPQIVWVCVCVCGQNELEVCTMLHIHISVHSVQCQFYTSTHTHTHTHTHTCILKPFEDSEPTGLKVDIACVASTVLVVSFFGGADSVRHCTDGLWN